MKKFNYIFVLMLSAVLFASCEDALEKEPLTSFTNSNYWTSETNVELYANYFYNEWTGYGNGTGSGVFYFPTLNDNQVSNSYADWKSTSVDASNSTWSSCYTEIRRANILIEKVPGIDAMSQSQKNKWIGIAKLYRAWQHYCLVRSFGDCYYIDTVLDPDADADVLYGARTDRDAVMDKVLADLNEAVSLIPASTSRTEYNQAVAQAIKSEICLYEGTFCKYRSSSDGQKAADASRAATYLNASKEASKAIMNNSNYSLTANYLDNYQSLDLAGNKEMILYKQYIYGVLAHSTVDYTCSSTMQSGISKAAFESYLFTDGKPLKLTSEDTNDHATFTKKADGNYLADIQALLAVRDPRLGMQIDPYLAYRGTSWARLGTDGKGMEGTSSTGYGVAKFDNLSVEYGHRPEGNKNETDAPIFWLSNVILNYAEACAETGDDAAAVAAVNQLRDRVGMPHLTTSPAADPANNMGVSSLIWEVRRERRVELMFDNDDRYWCLIRWHQLDKLDSGQYPDILRGAWVGTNVFGTVADGKAPVVDADGYINGSNGKTRTYDKKQYLRPIPTDQIQLNPEIGQNPGW